MRVTKRPKKVDVYYKVVQNIVSGYSCPTCKTEFYGAGIGKNVVRFRCDCGQELIVNHLINKSDGHHTT